MPPRDHGRRSHGLLAAVVASVLFIAACNDATPTPISTPMTPIATSGPHPTATSVPPSPTPRPTATPVPTPTPDPVTLGKNATKAAFDGDLAHAIQLQQQALPMLGGPESEVALRTRLAIGNWQLANGATTDAIAMLEPLSAISGSPVQTDALVLAGRARTLNGEPLSATLHYSAAIAASSVISPWLYLWTGEAYLAANQPGNAIAPLMQSLGGAPTVSQEFWRREQLALAHQLTSNYAAANEQYDVILSRAKSAAYRARILWQSAQVLQAAGKNTEAFARMNEVVAQYPKSGVAVNALQALLNAGQPVDELQRGIIGYNNGLYDAAREAFRRAITLYPKRENEIRYWAALNYIRLGSPADAYRNLDQNIASNPSGDFVTVQARGEKAMLLANVGDVATAKTIFTQMQTASGTGKDNAQIFFDVAAQFARNNDLVAEAAQAFAQAAALAPNEDFAPEALVRAAALRYRLGQYTETVSATQALIARYADKSETPLAQLWLAKAQIAAGNAPSGTATLQALAQSSSDSYEGTRAAELISDTTRAPLSLPAPLVLSLSKDGGRPGEGVADAEAWLATWTGITDTAKIKGIRDDIASDVRFVRGNELWRLGLKAEAVDEFEALREALAQDGVAQYQLALHFRDIGLYRQSIGAADTLMRLSPAKTPSKLPPFVAKLIYPAYYAELVTKHADEFGLDPLLVFALIRQESLFESFAESFAAANGLMQVIPSTGREINGDLSWPPNYTTRDLQRPYVGVRFGTYYLSKQRNYFKGDMYATLAAYNGGAGNAQVWKERGGGDPDLFFMSINFDETQHYIRTIGANYAIYHQLYGQ